MNTLRKNWFDAIERCTTHWNRVDGNKVILWFEGYRSYESYNAECELRKHGGYVLRSEYDSVCGKTFLIVKEPKTVL